MSSQTLLSMFSGGGLCDLGANAAGWQPVWAVEYDPAIAECYRANLGDHVTVGRVQDVDYRQWAGVDALWASPACTRASVANRGEGESAEDMEAAVAVVRAVREVGPRVMALENVWEYRNFRAFEHIHRSLLEMGYAVVVEHLCAADMGVPQSRRRLILRARRDDRGFPQVRRTHCKGLKGPMYTRGGGVVLPWVSWYEAICDLFPTMPVSALAPWQMARLPAEIVATACSKSAMPKALLVHGQDFRTMPVINGSDPAFTVTGGSNFPRALLIGGGSCGPNVPIANGDEPAITIKATAKEPIRALLIAGNSNAASRGDNQRAENEPAFTVLANSDRCRVTDGYTVLRLTPRALARLQSVPDTYVLPEKQALAAKIVGNGVPCLMAQRVMESLA